MDNQKVLASLAFGTVMMLALFGFFAWLLLTPASISGISSVNAVTPLSVSGCSAPTQGQVLTIDLTNLCIDYTDLAELSSATLTIDDDGVQVVTNVVEIDFDACLETATFPGGASVSFDYDAAICPITFGDLSNASSSLDAANNADLVQYDGSDWEAVAASSVNVGTATAAAADGANCAGIQFPKGVDTSWASQGCEDIDLGTDTVGNYVASITTATGVTGGAIGSEGSALTLTLDFGTDPTDGQCLAWAAASSDLFGASCSGSGGYDTIDNEDTPLTQRTTLNFEGAGVDCADDTDQTTCTIAGGGSLSVFLASTLIDTGADLDFGDSYFTAETDGSTVTIDLDNSVDWPNATTATALANNPTDCSANQFATTIAADGDLTCAAIGDADVPDDITIDLAATATALASNPADCSANQFATTIAANGDLTCAAIMDADVPDDITIDLAATATALAANPDDCSATQFATAIAASGNLTCEAIVDDDVPNDITIDLAATATALAADGANCTSGEAAGGVSTTGAAQDCTEYLQPGGVDVSDDINLGAGDYLTLSGDTLNVDAELATWTTGWGYLASPNADQDDFIFSHTFSVATTVTYVGCQTSSGAIATVSFDVRGLFATSAGNNVYSSLVCDDDGEFAMLPDFQFSTRPVDSALVMTFTAVSDTDGWIRTIATGTIDD